MSEETQACNSKADTDKNETRKKRCCISFKRGDGFFLRIVTYIANVLLILFAGIVLADSYGVDSFLVMLLFIPPVLSIWALRKQGDREERDLKKRIRKAHLRKELKVLSEFDVQP